MAAKTMASAPLGHAVTIQKSATSPIVDEDAQRIHERW